MRALVLALALSCVATPERVPVTASGSLVWSPDRRTLWVTSPDDDQLLAVDPTTLTITQSIPVPGGPAAVALVGDVVVVARTRRPALTLVRGDDVSELALPCGGSRAVVALSPTRALVACPHDDRVVVVDIPRRRSLRAVDAPGRPTALAVAGPRVYVTASRQGALRTMSRAALLSLTEAPDDEALDAPLPAPEAVETSLSSRPGFSASQVDALAAMPSGGNPMAVWQEVDRDSDRSRPAERGGYGEVFDDRPRIEPRVLASCGSRYARFDGSAGVASGPSALAWGGGLLWVTHRYTDTVLVLRCPESSGPPADGWIARVATFRTGRGPRGIVLSDDGRRAWVDVGFDHAVALLDLDAPARTDPREAALTARRPLGPTAPAPRLLAGRNLFHDGVDTHLTPSGVVTCATCHPDGEDDGLTWFLHTTRVSRRLRRTPPAWGARREFFPLHWDGEFADGETLTRATVLGLMGGDGLLVDAGAVAAWMASLDPPPPRPLPPSRRALAARGRAVFVREDVGCAGCHAGDALTDGRSHPVLDPGGDHDGALERVDTPTLRAVRTRGPHLHDGRAATLRAVLTTHNPGDRHGRTRHLSAAEIDALVAYLESL